MASPYRIKENYEIVCDRLFSLKSWQYEDKSSLLDTIVKWTSLYENSMPNRLEANLQHLRELLTEHLVIEPMLPVETILKVIQSDDVPSDAWLDCLRAAVQFNTSDSTDQTSISFDFAPVTVSKVDFNRQISDVASNIQRSQIRDQDQNEFDQLDLDDIYLTHQLLSSGMFSKTSAPSTPNLTAHTEEPLDIYQMTLLENLAELSELKWDEPSINRLRDRFKRSDIFDVITSLKTALLVIETIVINRISLRTHVLRITDTIISRPVHQWMKELSKVIEQQGKAKSVHVLLAELARENPSLHIGDLQDQYENVMRFYHTKTSQMTAAHFEEQLQFQDHYHKIAIIIQAVHLFQQYRPRDIQILSLLLLVGNPGQDKGRIAQIRTGEGKSIIVSMLAVFLSLPPMNKRVDIITTSAILAQRDAAEFAAFYRMFGLSVGHNCCDPGTKPNYRVHIVYGTVSHFAGDLLQTDFYLKTEIRGNRPYDAVIVDEVDSMFIDQRQHYTQLASMTPGYKSLGVILRFIYSFFQKYNITENDEFVIRQKSGYFKADALKFIRTKMREKELIRYSTYRQEYIDKNLPKWIKGAKRALYGLTLNVDYVISKDGRIVVVDYANTGVSQLNMHWGDGVHQFLELKHNLRMTPERMCDSFFSNVTLFKRYQPHLYGVTGTLGGEDARNFIRSVYKIYAFDVPKYIDSVFDIYPSQFSRFRQQWLSNICNECSTITRRNGRAVLIICETIQAAEEIQAVLSSQHFRIKLYLRSDLAEHIKPEEVHQGDVIVATNLAGRGTDLKTKTAVNAQGGLHVIVTFMPRNSRIEQQAFGRAGRQGQPGSARLILYDEQIGRQLDEGIDEVKIVDIWKRARDKQEENEMKDGIQEVKRVEMKDKLLTRFLEMAHSQKSKLSFADDIFKPGFSSLRELWASFVDTDERTAERRYSEFEKDVRQRLSDSIAILKEQPSDDAQHLINAQFRAVSKLIVHPKYFMYAGFHAFCADHVSDRKRQALDLYRRALGIDPDDFIAHYNTVPCHISDRQASVNSAIEAMDAAIRLLNQEIETRKMLEIFHDPPMPGEGSTAAHGPIDQTSLAELIYLQIVNSTFEETRKQLKQFDENKHEISCEFKHWPETLECLKGTKFEPLTNDINAEREEWLCEGLMWRYVFVIELKRCWWKTVFVFVMGVAQIVGGAYLCLKGQFRLGTSLILDGALDVYRAVATKITADFDLGEYFEAKVIKYGKLLLTPGGPIAGFLEPVASLEKIKMIGVAIDAVRQIDKNGFTLENLTQLASSGMALVGVNQTAVDFVQKLPERVKDAEALLSGDLDRILERGALAGLPVGAVQQIVKNGFTVESMTQLATDGMKMAGVDQKTIDLVQQLPDRIKDAQALVSGDLDRILERGMLVGLPVQAIQNIRTNGFSVNSITALLADGMALQGVDQKTIDLVKQLPERMKDAEALLSGDPNRLLERAALAGLPVSAIQQIVKNGFTVENAIQLAMDGMKMAGVDRKTIDIVQQLPERIRDAQALMSGDLDRILERGMLAGLPVQAIQNIRTNGFSVSTITALLADGMALQGVDQKTIDLVKQLPERMKDAEALLSGDLDRIVERGTLAGLPVKSIQQVVKNGFTVDNAAQLVMEGMVMAGIDQKVVNVVQQLPERIRDAQALISGDLDRILKRGMLAGLPFQAIQNIRRSGFSANTITRLITDGMTLQGVDQKTIDFVKQLPDRIEDAQALLSGDIKRILERGKLAGLPLNAIQQIATQGFSEERVAKLVVDGMSIAGVDQNTINFVEKLPERVRNLQAIADGNPSAMLENAESVGLPASVVRRINENGFSSDIVMQLALDSMTKAGVDAEKMGFVRRLPEQIKDAQALLSGDVSEICKRRLLGDLPIDAARQIFERGISAETVSQFIASGIKLPGVNRNMIKLVEQLPERIKDAQALLSGDISRMLERGMSAGLPLNTVQQIVRQGFSPEAVTQLTLEGMTLIGATQKQVEFVKSIPERLQGARALLDGDLNELLKRNTFEGVSIEALRQLTSQNNSIEAVKQIALTGMEFADIDKNSLRFMKEVAANVKDMERSLNMDLDQWFCRNMSGSIDQLLGLFNQNSLFCGEEKQIFQLVCRQMSAAENIPTGDRRTVVPSAFDTLNRQVGNLPVRELFGVALPNALLRVANREEEAIHRLYQSALDQLKSISGGFTKPILQVVQQILKSSEKWKTFESNKHRLDDNIRRILYPAVQREKQFSEALQSLRTDDALLRSCREAFNMNFNDTQKRKFDSESAIDRSCRHANFLLKQAMIEFVNDISRPTSQTKSPEMTKLLKNHLNQTFILPFAEQMCEQEMDLNDTALVQQFTNGLTYLQNQQRRK